MSVILGLNAFHAGSSAALLINGQPVIAIAEERLNRIKYYAGFPKMAIQCCLDYTGIKISDIEAVAIGRDSAANRGKKIEYVLKNPTKLLNFLKIKAFKESMGNMKQLFANEFGCSENDLKFKQYNVEHHLAHIASGYFISDWDSAAGISIDGSGDFVTCMLAECFGNKIDIKKRIYIPHSLGSLYTMISEFIGYKKYGDEGKVMGLSALGEDSYKEHFEKMVSLKNEQFELCPDYFMPFGSNQGLSIDENGQIVLQRHYSDKMIELFGKPREPYSELTKRDMDLALGVQKAFERLYLHLFNSLHRICPNSNVAMAGGCALNSVGNGMLFDATPFENTGIQPAAGDEGLALGAALYIARTEFNEKPYILKNSYLGPEFSDEAIKAELEEKGVSYKKVDKNQLLDETTDEIKKGNVIGWFQGRMEWGPRALGNRSIVCHPGLPDMKDILNARIKRREWFRPFAPSVLVEKQADIFENSQPSPFMLHVYKIKPEWREKLCAVNHVDNTGRIQTVSRDENPLYYDLISMFYKKSGIPVVLNTSFNENEPIVCTPSEAIDCFNRTKMDVLSIGSYICKKSEG